MHISDPNDSHTMSDFLLNKLDSDLSIYKSTSPNWALAVIAMSLPTSYSSEICNLNTLLLSSYFEFSFTNYRIEMIDKKLNIMKISHSIFKHKFNKNNHQYEFPIDHLTLNLQFILQKFNKLSKKE